MLDKDTISNFMSELHTIAKPYQKGMYVPGCKFFNDFAKLSIQYNIDNDDVGEIATQVLEYGFQVINIEKEDYLPAGTPVEKIKQRYSQIVDEMGLDAEILYLLGADEAARKHRDLIEKMCRILFFADERISIGLETERSARLLLKEVLQERHFALHPEDIERSKGWVDEDTIAFLQPYVKAGNIPWRYISEAIHDLMMDYGDFPLCENIVAETLKSMNVKGVAIANSGSLEPTSDEEELQRRMTDLLRECGLDFEACYHNGLESINKDIYTLYLNHYFFVNARVQTVDEANISAVHMLKKILKDEHNRSHYDEEVDTEDSVDLEMLNALKTYEKNGDVPEWVVVEHEERLVQKYGNPVVAEKVKLGTLAAIPAQAVALDKDIYMQPGSQWDDVRTVLIERIKKWDLEQAFASGSVPERNRQEYTQLVSMIYFALDQIGNRHDADNAFLRVFTETVIHDRLSKHPDEVPMSLRSEVEHIITRYAKNGVVPSFIQDQCLSLLSKELQQSWYAAQIYVDTLNAAGVKVVNLSAEDYVEPGTPKNDIEAKVQKIVKETDFDFEFYLRQDRFSDKDVSTKYRAVYLVYFADDDIQSIEEAETSACDIIFWIGREYMIEHYPQGAQAHEIIEEICSLYFKDGWIPTWTEDDLKQKLAEAKLDDWIVRTTLRTFRFLFDECLVNLAPEDTCPNGTPPDIIKEKIVSIAARYQLTADQVLRCLRDQEYANQLDVGVAINTIRLMVLIADELSETLDDVDGRIVSIMTGHDAE